MRKEYRTSHNIRGIRYDIVLTKDVKGMPGFAPSVYEDVEICRICVKFLEDEAPFLQFFTEPPNLEISEVKQILKLLKRGYKKKDFNPPPIKIYERRRIKTNDGG